MSTDRDRSPAVRAPGYPWLVVAASTVLVLVGSGSIFLVVVALKPIAAEFGWPRSVPSTAYALQYIGGGIGGIAMGHWLDRAGMGAPALIGAVMIGSGAVLASLISNQWQLYAIYGVMMGLLGQATLFGPLMANVMRWFERRPGMAVGIVASGQSLAGALWPPLFRHAVDTIGWRATFFWFGVLALCVMLPFSLALWRRPPEPAASGGAPAARAPPARLLRRVDGLPPPLLQALLCCAIVGCCIAMSLPLAHIVAYASDLGHAPARGAEMLALMLAASFLSRVLGGTLLVDRLGGLRALLLFSGTQAAMLLGLGAADGLFQLYLASALFGLGYGGIAMCYPVIVREHLPAQETGRRTGIVILFGALGMAAGGWMGGFVFDLSGSYQPAFAIAFACNLANLAIIAGLIRRLRGGTVRPLPA